jgi:hypothetical protein
MCAGVMCAGVMCAGVMCAGLRPLASDAIELIIKDSSNLQICILKHKNSWKIVYLKNLSLGYMHQWKVGKFKSLGTEDERETLTSVLSLSLPDLLLLTTQLYN